MLSLSPRTFHSLLIAPALLPLLMLFGSNASDNQPPVAVNDSYTIHGCASPLTPELIANDSDPDGDPFFISGFPQLPAHGNVSRAAGNFISYCANYAYIGLDSFTYQICDNHNACTTGSVSLTVVNQAPNPFPNPGTDFYTVHPSALLGPFLINDSDPDGDAVSCGDTFHECILTFPQHGDLSGSTQQDKKFYGANYGYRGSDSFTYNACDGLGLCTPTTVNINVVDQPPNGVTDSYNVHGGTVIGPFLINDSDPDGDVVSCGDTFHECILTFPQHGGLSGLTQNDIKSYGPNYGYTGSDSFTYNACDGLGLCTPTTVNLSVNNNAPVAGNDAYLIPGPSTTIGPFLINDSDPDSDTFGMGGTFQESIVTFPQHGSLSGLTQADKKLYSAENGFNGTDSFTYSICDDLGKCSIATVTLYVIGDGANDGPCDSCNGAVGSPVNVSNGNMYVQQNDYQLPSVGYGISVVRTYNSNSQRVGLFGRGWSSTYDQSLVTYDNNLLRFNHDGGRAIYFGKPIGSAGGLTPLIGDFHAQLTQNGAGVTLTLKDGSVEQFNSAGKLLSLTDRNGNTTTLTYGGTGFLSTVTDPFGRLLTVTTNANGQVTSISDSLGTIATYTYGGSTELLSVTYADNSAFQFSYDGNFRLTSATDVLGHIVESHTYDSAGRALTSERQGGVQHYTVSYVSDTESDVTDGLGRVAKYTFDKSKGRNVVTRVEGLCNCGGGGSQVQTWTYDNQLNVTSMSDALNHTTAYTYDGNGNRLTQTDAAGTITYTYNQFGQSLTRTDQLDGVATNTYDGQGNLLTMTDALNHTTTFTHNARGQMLTVTDARGNVTTFTYDTSGNMAQRKDANNITAFFFYDARSRLTKVRDGLSRSTLFAYDLVGRTNKVTYPDLAFVSFTYDLAGRRTIVTDERGNSTNYAYDGADRLTTVTDAANQATSYGYDAMSNLVSTTDALARVTNYDYDNFNRMVQVTYPPATAGATRLFEITAYDAGGNVTQRTDTAGRTTSFAYDNLDRTTSITDADNKTTGFEYDARGQVTGLLDALNQHYQFVFDAVGHRTQISRGGVSLSYGYDAVGNITQRTDYNGTVTNYAYDNLNRLKTITYPTRAVTYSYDPLDNLTLASNENGSVYIGYDNRYRITSFTDPFFYGVSYNYDAAGNRTKLKINGATYATYSYDAVNRLSSLKDGANLNFGFSYDAANRLTGRSAPNGVASSYGYDDLDRLIALTHTAGATTLVANQYAYNDAGKITSWTNASGNHAYNYDAVNRLTAATNSAAPNESYVYDGAGNRTASHLSASYSYQPFNKLISSSTAGYTYDNNGNLISKTDVSGTTTFSYDEDNRLTQVSLPSGLTVSYKYDGLGRRIQRTTSAGANERYVYDGNDVLLDLNADWSVATTYFNGLGFDNHLRQTSSTTGVSYFLTDHLGSTAALTNASGTLVEQQGYDSFGNSAGSARTRYGYTGRERDPDTLLLYYRTRFYDPQIGRFISEDQVGFRGGVNWYAYVANNPVDSIDPMGRWAPDAHDYIIEEAFKNCLSKPQREKLKAASADVDKIFPGQLEANAYQHGMRGGPGESEEHARKAAADFVNGHGRRARELAPKGCNSEIPLDALWELGQALHTIMDMTSPAHEGFQIWNGPPYPTGLLPVDAVRYAEWYRTVLAPHEAKETRDRLEHDQDRLKMVKKMVRDEFAKAFGDCGCCTD